MAKRQGNGQQQQRPVYYPPPPRGPDAISLITLAGIVVVLMISFANWREIDSIQESLDSRLSQLDSRISELSNRPAAAPAAAPTSNGPQPNRVYPIKTAGAFFKGPEDAPVTIAEFSDFQ